MALVPSYVQGISRNPLLGETIGQVLDRMASENGERPFLTSLHQGLRWSYSEFKQRAEDFAAGLLGLGLSPGDRIAMLAPNCAEWLVLMFGAAKAGVILVNVNPASEPEDVAYALNKTGCRAIVCAHGFMGKDYVATMHGLVVEIDKGKVIRSSALPELRWIIGIGDLDGLLPFDAVPAHATAENRDMLPTIASRLQFEDPIYIQFTSGTTGKPKAALMTHHSVVNNGLSVGDNLRYTTADKLCLVVPFSHSFGMVLGAFACLTHGASIVLPGESFAPQPVLAAVHTERCTALYGVPAMFIALMAHPDFKTFDLASLRTGAMGGASCPIEVMRRVIEDMHLREITIVYGMTEMTGVCFQSAVDDPIERRVSTIGHVMPHVEAKIVNAAGEVAPRGTPGELYTRGYSRMLGYWEDDARTAAAIDKAGWMHTGDLAVIDDEGYCKITGRIKDIINCAGQEIYPRDVEDTMFGHPSVLEAQAFGIPDADKGETLCIWVRLRNDTSADEESLRTFCTQSFPTITPLHVRIVSSFPSTVSGKVQKFKMRELMLKEFAA